MNNKSIWMTIMVAERSIFSKLENDLWSKIRIENADMSNVK